jgi:ketosteroid isomerase-like protein
MRNLSIGVGVGFALILVGCSSPDKQIRANYAEMDQALSAKDVDKAMSYFAPDTVQTDTKGKPIPLAAMKTGLQTMFNAASSVESKTTISSVEVKGPGVTVSMASKMTATTPLGPLVASSTSRDYWEQVGGAWKIKRSRSLTESVTLNGKPLPGR